ncbi:MAG: nucleotidyltransferase domain-containing protein [Thermosphaera sp.]|jgi:predicted nucleotidyltransferase|nr:nucleotidyltransferase domain-containing protein [Thermosphaera sp.]
MGEEAIRENWVKNVERVLSELSREFNVEAAIVFGSWSKSGGGDWSDVDLLIVSNSVSELRILDRFALTSEFRKWRVDVFLYTLKELENMVNKGNPIALSALVEGIPLIMNREVEKLRRKAISTYKRTGRVWIKIT